MNATQKLETALRLLREADELWTTSWANEYRGVWDAEWDKRRREFLAEHAPDIVAFESSVQGTEP